MESKPIEVVLSPAEKLEVVKHTLRDKKKDLEECERKIRELKREDAERAFLYTFVDQQYVNPENINNEAEIAPLEQEREVLIYVISCVEAKLAELEGGGAPAPQAASQDPQTQQQNQPRQQGGNMWQ